ncbi:hypothetical protein GN958_ATG16039 [Phytophthora infestans]|uniref:Uncharacterized protein n=1 Tax=Phytophthora infestans TaxID=4787 RepID=A0A8S9U3G0_PHYIN|nr:hypothetical protein GN958_ATG16039 [Phytophthora infestans]
MPTSIPVIFVLQTFDQRDVGQNVAATLNETHSNGAVAHDRVGVLKEALRRTIFSMVTRGLYEEHKLLFLVAHFSR